MNQNHSLSGKSAAEALRLEKWSVALHKYLYTQDEPINCSDPSGNQGDTEELTAESTDGTLGAESGIVPLGKGAQGLLPQMAPVRSLTPGEISLAETVFGNTINYSQICIHLTKYSVFISADTFVTPDGTMYMDPSAKAYSSDFSTLPAARAYHQSIFIHEMTHVWQYQHGVNVVKEKLEHPFESDYNIDFSTFGTKKFIDFNIEQQGNIVEDYFLESHWGWGGYIQPEADGSKTKITFPPLSEFIKELKPYFPLGQ